MLTRSVSTTDIVKIIIGYFEKYNSPKYLLSDVDGFNFSPEELAIGLVQSFDLGPVQLANDLYDRYGSYRDVVAGLRAGYSMSDEMIEELMIRIFNLDREYVLGYVLG